MTTVLLVKSIILLALFALLILFSLSETAVMSLSNENISTLKKRKGKLLKYVNFWERNNELAIATLIVGLNISVTAISIVSASLIADLMLSTFKQTIVFPALVIVAALIFGNIFPKTFARYNVVKMAPLSLFLIYTCSKVFRLPAKLLLKISSRLVRFASKNKESQIVKADEIDFLLSDERTSPLSKDFRKMASNIMDFQDTKILQVMTSRSELFAVDMDDPRSEIIKDIIDSQYSRVPAYRGDLSNVVGIIYSKDLAISYRNAHFIILEDLLRPAYYVPESASLNSVLKEFRSGHHHCAIVVNEFGLTVGIVSIEDLLEEIVGDVSDEFDTVEKRVVLYGHSKQQYLVQAQELVLDINEDLNIEIPDGDYSTVGGWVLELFGKIPRVGEKIMWKNYEIEIKDANEKKINKVVFKCITK
jgi:CBS domain containing-hemolysin-like protein